MARGLLFIVSLSRMKAGNGKILNSLKISKNVNSAITVLSSGVVHFVETTMPCTCAGELQSLW